MPRGKIFGRFDWSNKDDRFKLVVLSIGVVLFFIVAFASLIKVTMYPSFCAQCHEMTPEYVTWKVSSHKRVACTDCHIKPGLVNLLVHKLKATKELFLHFTEAYEIPITMSHEIEQEICLQCHDINNRRFSYSGDLIVPHDRHSKAGINCVACHSGVAHGNVDQSGLIKEEADFSKWTISFAEKYMVKDNTEPKMNDCLECHNKRKVSTRCEACHSVISEPADHKEAGWGTSHGLKARQDLSYCNKCHSYSLTEKGKALTVAEYARGNNFCRECHKKRPASHGDNWMNVHSKRAKADREGCLVCHSDKEPTGTEKDKVTSTYCFKCHGKAAAEAVDGAGASSSSSAAGQESGENAFRYHASNWRKVHPQFVKEQGIQKGKCFSCHSNDQCFRCHTSGGKLN